MRNIYAATVAACLFTATTAFAQTAAPRVDTAPTPAPAASPNAPMTPAPTTGSTTGPGNAAVKNPEAKPVAAPVEGANSFTEGQARSRIEGQGFTAVTGLVKGDDGVWRGKATKGGATSEVALDFKGNVTSK